MIDMIWLFLSHQGSEDCKESISGPLNVSIPVGLIQFYPKYSSFYSGSPPLSQHCHLQPLTSSDDEAPSLWSGRQSEL